MEEVTKFATESTQCIGTSELCAGNASINSATTLSQAEHVQ